MATSKQGVYLEMPHHGQNKGMLSIWVEDLPTGRRGKHQTTRYFTSLDMFGVMSWLGKSSERVTGFLLDQNRPKIDFSTCALGQRLG